MQARKDEHPGKPKRPTTKDDLEQEEKTMDREADELLSEELSEAERRMVNTGEQYAIQELYAHIPEKNLKLLIQPEILRKKKLPPSYKHERKQETLRWRQGLARVEKEMLKQEIIEDALIKYRNNKNQFYFKDQEQPQVMVLGIQQHEGRARTIMTVLRDSRAKLEKTKKVSQQKFVDAMTRHLKKLKEHSVDNAYIMTAVLLTEVSNEQEIFPNNEEEVPTDFYSKIIHTLLHRLELPGVKVLQRNQEGIWHRQTLYLSLECIELEEEENSIWPHVGNCETCQMDMRNLERHEIDAKKRVEEISTLEQNDYKIELLMDLHADYNIDRAMRDILFVPNEKDGHIQFRQEKHTVTLHKMDLLNSIRKAHEVFGHKRGGAIIAFSKPVNEEISQATRDILKPGQDCYNPAMIYLSSELTHKEEYKKIDENRQISREEEQTPWLDMTEFTTETLKNLMQEYKVNKEELDFFIDSSGIENLESQKIRLLITNLLEELGLHGKNIYIIDGLTNIAATSSCLTKTADLAVFNLSCKSSDCDQVHIDITKNKILYSLCSDPEWTKFQQDTEELARELMQYLVMDESQKEGVFSDLDIEIRKQKQREKRENQINQGIIANFYRKKEEQMTKQGVEKMKLEQEHIEQLYQGQRASLQQKIESPQEDQKQSLKEARKQKIEAQFDQRNNRSDLEQGENRSVKKLKESPSKEKKQEATVVSAGVEATNTQGTKTVASGLHENQTVPQSPQITQEQAYASSMFNSPIQPENREIKDENRLEHKASKKSKEEKEEEQCMIFTNQQAKNVDYMTTTDQGIREVLEDYYNQFTSMQLHRFKLSRQYQEEMDALKLSQPEEYWKRMIDNRQARIEWAINLPESDWKVRDLVLRLPDQLQEIWYYVNSPDTSNKDKIDKCSPREGDLQLNQNLKTIADDLMKSKNEVEMTEQHKTPDEWHKEKVMELVEKIVKRERNPGVRRQPSTGTGVKPTETQLHKAEQIKQTQTIPPEQKQTSQPSMTVQEILESLRKQHSHPGGIPLLNPPEQQSTENQVTEQEQLKDLTLPIYHKFAQPLVQEPNQRTGWHLLNPFRPEEYQIDEEGHPIESASNMYNKFRERQFNRTAQTYGLKKEEMAQQDMEFSKLIKRVLTNTNKYGTSTSFQELYEQGEQQYDKIMKEMEVDHLIPLPRCATTQAVLILASNKELTKKIHEGIGYEGNIGSILDPSNNHITVRTYLNNEEIEVFDWEARSKEEILREEQLEKEAIRIARLNYDKRQQQLIELGYDPRKIHPEGQRKHEEYEQNQLNEDLVQDQPIEDYEGEVPLQEHEEEKLDNEPSSNVADQNTQRKGQGQQKTVVQISAEQRSGKKRQPRKKKQNASEQEQREGQEKPKKQVVRRRMGIVAHTGTSADLEESNKLRLALKGEYTMSPDQLKQFMKTLLLNFINGKEQYDQHKKSLKATQQQIKQTQNEAQIDDLKKEEARHQHQLNKITREAIITKRQIIKLRQQPEYEQVETQLAVLLEKVKIKQPKARKEEPSAEQEAINQDEESKQKSDSSLPNNKNQDQEKSDALLPIESEKAQEKKRDKKRKKKDKKKKKNKKRTLKQMEDQPRQDLVEDNQQNENQDVDMNAQDDQEGEGGLYDHGDLQPPPANPHLGDQDEKNDEESGQDFQLHKKQLIHDPPNPAEQEMLADEQEIRQFRAKAKARAEGIQMRVQLQRGIERIAKNKCREIGQQRAKQMKEDLLNKAIHFLDMTDHIEQQTGWRIKPEPEIMEIIERVKRGDFDQDNQQSEESSEELELVPKKGMTKEKKYKVVVCNYCDCIITTEEHNGIDLETGQSDPNIVCCTLCLNKVRRQFEEKQANQKATEETSQRLESRPQDNCGTCGKKQEVVEFMKEVKAFCKVCDVINDTEIESDSQIRVTRATAATADQRSRTLLREDVEISDENNQADRNSQSQKSGDGGQVNILDMEEDPRTKLRKTDNQANTQRKEHEKYLDEYLETTVQFQNNEKVFACTKCDVDITRCDCVTDLAISHYLRSLHQTEKVRTKREKQLQAPVTPSQEEIYLHRMQQRSGARVLDTYYRMQQNKGHRTLAMNAYQRDLNRACGEITEGGELYRTDGQFEVKYTEDVYVNLISLKTSEEHDETIYKTIPKHEWERDLQELLRENREVESVKDKKILQDEEHLKLGETGYSILGSTQGLHRIALRAIQIWEGILNNADDQELFNTANTIIQDVATRTECKQSILIDDMLYRAWKIYERLLKKAQAMAPVYNHQLGIKQPDQLTPPSKDYADFLDITRIMQSHKRAVATASQKPKSMIPPTYRLLAKAKLLCNLVPHSCHTPFSLNTQQNSSAFTQTQAIHAYQMKLNNDRLVPYPDTKPHNLNILEVVELGMGTERGAEMPQVVAGVKMLVQKGYEKESQAQTTDIIDKTFDRIEYCKPIIDTGLNLESEQPQVESEHDGNRTDLTERQKKSKENRKKVKQYIDETEIQMTPIQGILRGQSNLDQITDLISLAMIPQAIPIVTSLMEKEQYNATYFSEETIPRANRKFYSLMNKNLPIDAKEQEERAVNNILARLAKIDIAKTDVNNSHTLAALMTSKQAFNDRYTSREWRSGFTQIKWSAFATYLAELQQPNHAYRKPLYNMPKHFNGHSVFSSFTIKQPKAMQTLVPGMEWIDAINVAVGRIVFHTIEDALRCHYRSMDMLQAAIALHASKGPIFFTNPCIFVKEGKYIGRVAFSVHMTTTGNKLERAQNDIRYFLLILNSLPTTRVIGEITYKYGAAKPYLTIAYPFVYSRQRQWQTKLAFLDGMLDLTTNLETCQYILQDALRIKWYVMHWHNDYGSNMADTRKKFSYLQIAWHHHYHHNSLSDTPINNLDLYEKFFRPDKAAENRQRFAAGSRAERNQLLFVAMRDDRTHFHGQKTKFKERFETMKEYSNEMTQRPQNRACYEEVNTDRATELLKEYDTENIEHSYQQAIRIHENIVQQQNARMPHDMQDYISNQHKVTGTGHKESQVDRDQIIRRWKEEDLDQLARIKQQAISHVQKTEDEDVHMQ